MKAATVLTDRVEEAWDLYCSEDYKSVIEMEKGSDIQELQALARLESDVLYRRNVKDTEREESGPFSGLLHAMKLYHSYRYDSAANELGKWLINKGYYSRLISNRFTDCCYRARQFDLLFTVSGKMIKNGADTPEWIEACLTALYETGKYEEGAKLYRRFEKKIKDTNVIHKAALCLFHSEDFSRSEKLLLKIHEQITGRKYKDGFQEAKKRYESKIKDIQKLEQSCESEQDKMELGMVYLFAGNYSKAMKMFQQMLPSEN